MLLTGWAVGTHQSPTSAQTTPKTLTDIAHLVASEGVWEGEWWIRGPNGELRSERRSIKKMKIVGEMFQQVNEYTYPDGKKETFRFVGRLNKKSEVDFASPDRDYFKDTKVVYVAINPNVAAWVQVRRATGKTVGCEFFTTMGDIRFATNHRYKFNDDYTKAVAHDGVTTIKERRIADAGDKPLFVMTPEEEKKLIWRE